MSTISLILYTITCFLAVTASARLDNFYLGDVLKVAQSPAASVPAPGPSSDCSTIVFDMVECIGYLSDGDNEPKPSDSCCSGLKSVLKVNEECLCEAMKMSASMGIALNLTKAKSLPAECGVKHFSSSICDSSSPSRSPAALAPAPVAAAPAPAPAVTAPVSPPKKSPAHAPAPAPAIAALAPEASPASPPAGGAVDKNAPAPSTTPAAHSGAYAISTSISLVIGMLIVSLSYLSVM